jgi:hypothetical protein
VANGTRRLEFGNLGHILFLRQVELRSLEGEMDTLVARRSKLRRLGDPDDENSFFVSKRNEKAHIRVCEELARVKAAIDTVHTAIDATKAEMLFIQRRSTA